MLLLITKKICDVAYSLNIIFVFTKHTGNASSTGILFLLVLILVYIFLFFFIPVYTFVFVDCHELARPPCMGPSANMLFAFGGCFFVLSILSCNYMLLVFNKLHILDVCRGGQILYFVWSYIQCRMISLFWRPYL